ncbi:MAG: hypothetical protein OXH06_03655 [Gemmatimonadetes bacterium]|nr:hypothetical protein [Gemmatimonadota bacterium]
MVRSRVTGGSAIERLLRQIKRSARQPKIEVGFFDTRMNVLAAQLEFGNPSTNLLERPAFRLSSQLLQSKVSRYIEQMLHGRYKEGYSISESDAVKIAILSRDTLRQAYHDFHGAPLSERQQAREARKAYADEQLIGAEGPKLIEHIKAYVNDKEVG